MKINKLRVGLIDIAAKLKPLVLLCNGSTSNANIKVLNIEPLLFAVTLPNIWILVESPYNI